MAIPSKNDLLVRHSKLSFDTIGTRSDVRIYVCQPGYDSRARLIVKTGANQVLVGLANAIDSYARLEFMSRFYGFPIDSVDPGVPGACAESREGA